MSWSNKAKGALIGFIAGLTYFLITVPLGLYDIPFQQLIVAIISFPIFLAILGIIIGSFIDIGKHVADKESHEEGSKKAFQWSLAGGIIGLIMIPIYVIFFVDIPEGYSTIFYSLLLIPIIFGLVTIVASFYMKKDSTLKKASIIVLIISILGSNIISLVGAIIGLRKDSK